MNSARAQKLAGRSVPRNTIVIISDHMSAAVRNHLARAFYFHLANGRACVIVNDVCSLIRVYFVNSRIFVSDLNAKFNSVRHG